MLKMCLKYNRVINVIFVKIIGDRFKLIKILLQIF